MDANKAGFGQHFHQAKADLCRIARASCQTLFHWGLSVFAAKYYELGCQQGVQWLQKEHVNKNGNWHRGATPPGIPTSISGQEGYHPLLRKVEGSPVHSGALISKLVKIVLPFVSKKDLDGEHRNPRRDTKISADRLYFAREVAEKRCFKLSDDRILYRREDKPSAAIDSDLADWWLVVEGELGGLEDVTRPAKDWYKFTNLDCASPESCTCEIFWLYGYCGATQVLSTPSTSRTPFRKSTKRGRPVNPELSGPWSSDRAKMAKSPLRPSPIRLPAQIVSTGRWLFFCGFLAEPLEAVTFGPWQATTARSGVPWPPGKTPHLPRQPWQREYALQKSNTDRQVRSNLFGFVLTSTHFSYVCKGC